ncbi:MAG: hypothetical protein IKZ84_07980 [Victivallales bacterium]|nr:hypothetical protein [Victivallales bacterium]
MKPSELTKEMFDNMVFDDLVNSYKYAYEEARKLIDRFPDVMEEQYVHATDEENFILTHRKGDTESLEFFRNGNYIKSVVSGTAMCLDLLW